MTACLVMFYFLLLIRHKYWVQVNHSVFIPQPLSILYTFILMALQGMLHTSESEVWWEDDVYSCALYVKHDAEVNSYTAQHSKAVHKRPIRGVQGDLVTEDRKWHQVMSKQQTKTQSPTLNVSGLPLVLLFTKMFSTFHFRIRYLQVDDHDKWGRSDHSEGLVIRWRLSVLTHRL